MGDGPAGEREGLTATVLVPTTGDRGPLLPFSVGSVLAQTVTDIEVFLLLDGAEPETREAAELLASRDRRVRVFAFPKSARRGERERHAVLTEHARGRIVCYLCDRDLWLPDHLAEMDRVLSGADFGHTLRFAMEEGDRIGVRHVIDLADPADRAVQAHHSSVLPLSMGGHTMDLYRRLPHGWRTTPPGRGTDRYMWSQILAEPSCRVGWSPQPTVLYFKRGDHPGWSTARRTALLEHWSAVIDDPAEVELLRRRAWEAILVDRSDRARRLRHLDRPWVDRAAERALPEHSYRALRRRAVAGRDRLRRRP
ncbi:glycosyltransferase family A protein [Iamia majanohamensis]|uniref:Glycosyltransferase family A protein n=1 Tax=Iamia majanohamensis TaxID=467976 RepID=A0AAE9YCS1_9ACTN|nr:glycosyltransferase family A protein [Iamia majanohamensis]WCO68669.1 glycosyltransferase family A protein [Iamia majanohamensis]